MISRKPWTREDKRRLIALLEVMTYERAAVELNRTPRAVAHQLCVMGHGVRQGRMSCCAAAGETGWHWSSVARAAKALRLGVSNGRRVFLTPEEVEQASTWLATRPYAYAKGPAHRARIGCSLTEHFRATAGQRTQRQVGDHEGCAVLESFGPNGNGRYLWSMRCTVTGHRRLAADSDLARGLRRYCHPCAAKIHHAKRRASWSELQVAA